MDKEDYFEAIPLKASKFNSELLILLSTSQAFNEVPSPHEKKPAEEELSEDHPERLENREGNPPVRRQTRMRPH